jgi:hypothetical protein
MKFLQYDYIVYGVLLCNKEIAQNYQSEAWTL